MFELTAVEILFYATVLLIAYTYVLFPAILFLRAKLSPRPYLRHDITPTVSLIVCCHNEAQGIEAKLQNLLALDYPRDRLEIIVASDGSDDGTDEIVRRYLARGIRLLSLPRRGKAEALNDAAASAKGEVLVFSDANSMYAGDAVRVLVRPFADASVGGVAGNQCYLNEREGRRSTSGEHSYWSFDRRLKYAESVAGNTISATGSIYAIRRSLFVPAPAGVTDDFVTSTRVIAQGYRLVFEPGAISYEPAAASSGFEFRRKVRIMTRGLRGVWLMRELLNPFRHGFYAVQLFTHKVLRRLVVFPLIALFILSALLWNEGTWYQVITVAQGVFYFLALAGLLLGATPLGRSRLFALPSFFCMVNAAAFVAAWNVVTGRRIDFWTPQRQPAAAQPCPSVAAQCSTTPSDLHDEMAATV